MKSFYGLRSLQAVSYVIAAAVVLTTNNINLLLPGHLSPVVTCLWPVILPGVHTVGLRHLSEELF